MSDETMRSLLEVHRDEINRRDEDIASLNRDVGFHSSEVTRLKGELTSKLGQLDRANQRANEHLTKIAKLEGVIESLKIGLQNEREAHTAARDAEHGGDPA